MKRMFLGFFLFVSLSVGAWADVKMEVVDFPTRTVRLTYEIEDTQAGNRMFLFPKGGFIHSASREWFQVESVFDKGQKQELEFEVLEVPDSGLPQLQIQYPEAVKQGGKKELRITVRLNLPESDMTQDTAGRCVYVYETSHPFEFVIPVDQYVVFTNQAMQVFERGVNVVVRQSDSRLKKIVVKTWKFR